MAFSETELVFLALIFIFGLGFLMQLLGARDNTSTVKKTKKKRKRPKGRHEDTAKTISTGVDENLTKMTTENLIILVA